MNPAFLVDSREELYCPDCGCPLRLRDHRKRIWRREGGKKDWLLLGRYRCDHCNRLHIGLPEFLAEYKHYDNRTMETVIDENVGEDLSYEDYPCEMTMKRWLDWFKRNRTAIEGQIRSAAMRFLDLTEEFLRSMESLLAELRERIRPGWLGAVLRIIYNSGGRLST